MPPAVQLRQGKVAGEHFDASGRGKVGVKNTVALAQEDAEAEVLAFGGRHAEVVIEV
jgi:hypothetical protein